MEVAKEPEPIKKIEKKKEKEKAKKAKLTTKQWYLKILKYVTITWLTIGLVLAISFHLKEKPFFSKVAAETLFSDFKKR